MVDIIQIFSGSPPFFCIYPSFFRIKFHLFCHLPIFFVYNQNLEWEATNLVVTFLSLGWEGGGRLLEMGWGGGVIFFFRGGGVYLWGGGQEG